MRIKAKDEAGRWINAEVDDNRYASLDAFFRNHPDILGNGAGGAYGRSSARDAVEAQAFVVSQLAWNEPGVFERQYQPMMYETLLPGVISYAAGEWAQSIEYTLVDYVAMGRRMSPAANDMPFADVAYARISKPVAYGGEGYFYNQEELRIAAYLQRPLPTDKLNAANIGFRRHMNKVALQGETSSNFTGLFNNASVTAANRPSGAVWDAATADTIIADITAGLTAVQVATVTNDFPTHIALPVSSAALLLKPRSTASDTTVLEFIKRLYPGLTITAVTELVTLGAGGTKRMAFWNPGNDNMKFHIPMPIKFLAPQMDVLRVVVPGEYKYGGLEIRRPATAYYMDGI